MIQKSVLITGASRGIGRAAAIYFARAGYFVGINYHHSREEAESLLKLLQENGLQGEIYQADVSKPDEAQRMADDFFRRCGRIDVLVNNAGIARIAPFLDVKPEELEELIGVDLLGAMYLSRAVIPYMLRRQKGNIVNISSVWGREGASCEVAYSAAKAGIIGFTKALAKEMGPSGIRVNCVAPGVIDSDMNRSLDEETRKILKDSTPLGTIGSVGDVAESILFLASDKAEFITGETLGVTGGFSG